MFACEAPHSVFSGALGEGMLWAIADCLATVGNNNVGFGGQTCVVISPLQAERLSQKGWSKGDVKYFLYEKARVPLSKLRAVWRGELEGGPERDGERWPKWFDVSEETALVPVVRRPENIHVVVAGGRGVGFCAVLPGWGFMGGYAVTKRIAAGRPGSPGA